MVHGVGDGIGLDGIADTETGEHPESGEKKCQPFPFFAETVPDIVHRAADIIAEHIFFAVTDGQCRFGKLGGHTGQCDQPHPEKGARPAEEDRRGHSRDIAGADRGGHGGHQRIERRDIAGLVAFLPAAPHHSECEGNAALCHETVTDRQKEAGACQKRQQNRAADEAVELSDQFDKSVHADEILLKSFL